MKKISILISVLVLSLAFQNCSNKDIDDVSTVEAYQGDVFNAYHSENIDSLEYWDVNPGVVVNGVKSETHFIAKFDHVARNIDYKIVDQPVDDNGNFNGPAKVRCTDRLSVNEYNTVVRALVGSVLVKDKGTGNSGLVKSNIAIKGNDGLTRVYGFNTEDDDYGDQVVHTPSEMQDWFKNSKDQFCAGLN